MVFDREEKVIYQQTEVIESEPEPRAPREQKETKQPHPVIAQEKELRNVWQSVDITFRQLKNADVGDVYEAPLGNHMYYTYDIATVVYIDEDIVVLKIKTLTELPWVFQDTVIRLVGVTLF